MSDAVQRKGDWFVTYTGKQFWPFDARVDDICIEDIAHSLALQTRWNGHCSTFYSIADHSVACADIAYDQYRIISRAESTKDIWRWALMHDAAEAYIGDIVSPIKRYLLCADRDSVTSYLEHDLVTVEGLVLPIKAVETRLLGLIAEKFGLPEGIPGAVHMIDRRMLVTEALQLTNYNAEPDHWVKQKPWSDFEPYDVKLPMRSPVDAEAAFLEAFQRWFPRHRLNEKEVPHALHQKD
ncbi:phosphohydrolase [Patescibacteria group bacterium]|nr:phosphohydrolase [Patescibacteria group bacterium]